MIYGTKSYKKYSCVINLAFWFQVEYILVKFDDKNKVTRVSLRAPELLAILNQREADDPNGK